MTQQSEQLPETYVLSYISAINTPTRVRRTAAVAITVLGSLLSVVGLVGTFSLVYELSKFSGWFFHGPLLLTVERIAWQFPVQTTLFIPSLASPILLFTFPGIYRARPLPCHVAHVFLLLPFLQIAFIAALYLGYALVMVLPFKGRPDRDYLPVFFSIPLWLMALLLLLDLRTFLKWIIRNPTAEKPRTPFLPHMKSSASGTSPNL